MSHDPAGAVLLYPPMCEMASTVQYTYSYSYLFNLRLLEAMEYSAETQLVKMNDHCASLLEKLSSS